MSEQVKNRQESLKAERNEKTKSDLEEMKRWAEESRRAEQIKSTVVKRASADKAPVQKKAAVDSQPIKTEKKEQKPIEQKGSTANSVDKTNAAEKKASQPKPNTAAKRDVAKSDKAAKGKKKHNYLLWVTVLIIAIPCLILLYIFIGSRENSRTPVEGSRFKNALDPKITEEDLQALKTTLTFDGAEAVEINLKSATLRININTKDDMNQEAIHALMVSAYDKVIEKLPVDTYFTNKKNGENVVKMYDLEISAYNYIPKSDEEKSGQIHLSRVKNAASEHVVDDVLSTAKDKQSAEEILNPDTSNPPTNDKNGSTEGE